MRHQYAPFLRKAIGGAIAGLALALPTLVAQAQVPVFDNLDWLLDRGQLTFVPGNSAIPLRPGTTDYNLVGNNPSHAVPKWVFPRTSDLNTFINAATPFTAGEIVDNANLADPLNYTDTNGAEVRVTPPPPLTIGNTPLNMAHSQLNGAWNLPLVPVGDPADYRAPGLGFSINEDPSQTYDFDYAFISGVEDDFNVDDGNGTLRPATPSELAALPYTSSAVYASVNNDLINNSTATSIYSSGTYNLVPGGGYGVDIYVPGDGTIFGGNVLPSCTTAFVRVSWKNTITATGQFNFAGINDPVNSRIYEVDLEADGQWIHLAGGGTGPAVFPLGVAATDQIVVTIYNLTNDNVNDPTLSGPPLITADAVRFVPQAVGGAGLVTANGTISPGGRILGPVVGTGKYAMAPFNLPDAEPLIFFAREEDVSDTTLRIPVNPTLPVTGANPIVADPVSVATVPVFYCIDNQNGDATTLDGMGNPITITSSGKVRWRFVGQPDAANGSGTSSASPMIANVRCRDGNTRTMVYFLTTNGGSASIGHIYALDPLGDRPTATTTAYWTYPSYHPVLPTDPLVGNITDQYHDPNYYNPNVAGNYDPGTYPPASAFWAADQTLFANVYKEYYDGDLVHNAVNPAETDVRADTQINFGGVQSSPVVIDDPANPTGPQLLVVGNMNGRAFAFDAGGRGDFLYNKLAPNDLTQTVPGTTQRMWAWPHFGADAYRADGMTGTNTIFDDTSLSSIPASPTFDPNYPVPGGNPALRPVMIGGGDGHMYALNAGRDQLQSIVNRTGHWVDRRVWVYPAPDNPGLGGAPGTAAVFTPTGQTNAQLYFTCAGRVYSLPEAPALSASGVTVNALKWVYPFTPNPPFSSMNDETTDALAFAGTAPVLMSQAMLNVAAVADPLPVTNDLCYVVTSQATDALYSGTVIALDALGGAGQQTTVIASGASLSGSTTGASAIGALLTGLPGLAADTVDAVPALIFADDDGDIWGISARPDAVELGPIGATPALMPIWAQLEGFASRNAPAALVNGTIVEGDQGGQLRAYGVGTGIDGLGNTLGPGEPPQRGLGAGLVSIDVRTVDVYPVGDPTATSVGTAGYDNFMLSSSDLTGGKNPFTPNRKSDAGGYSKSVLPLGGNIAPGSTAVAADWGDYFYVAVSGVYHAQQTKDQTTAVHGMGPPTITVQFTISQNGQSLIKTLGVPLVSTPINAATGELWPDDPGITAAEHNNLQIYGIDQNFGPTMSMTLPEQLTGPAEDAMPWVIRYAVPINPGGIYHFVPGSGMRITAVATISQAIVGSGTNGQLSENSGFPMNAGEHNYVGLNLASGQPGFVFPPSPASGSIVGTARPMVVTNPIALSVRGTMGNPLDGTGSAVPNVVGLYPSIDNALTTVPGDVGELINNGNARYNPYGPALAISPIKRLFAPLPMVPDGSTSTFMGVDNTGAPAPAFFVTDRSNMSRMTGRSLNVQVITQPITWHGFQPSISPINTGSSVMNPLPWEQLPTDAQATRDYPSISPSAVTATINGAEAINGRAPLIQPVQPDNNPAHRVIQPTPITFSVAIPKFQPADVNYGLRTFNGVTFGSPFVDMSGVTRGTPAALNSIDQTILGPNNVVSGDPAVLNSLIAYPAAGYISTVVVRVVVGGTNTSAATRLTGGLNAGSAGVNIPFRPQDYFNQASGNGAVQVQDAFRATQIGVAVPPSVKARVAESLLDIGKEPQGAGYSPLTNAANHQFRLPFAPNASGPYLVTPDPVGGPDANPSPWDQSALLGQFFQPFTLINESNVNLVDLRIGKLSGQNGSSIGGQSLLLSTDPTVAQGGKFFAVTSRLVSDQVDNNAIAPLFATPFSGPGVGNIGVVSSYDHGSINSNPNNLAYPENPLWPLPNPFVNADDIAAANTNGAMLPTANAPANGIMAWAAQIQPQPTVGKPRVGDSAGRIATVPDRPYDAPTTDPNFQLPRVGIAVPFGTPAGTYSAPIQVFEDNTPIQWQEWLAHLAAANGAALSGVSHDGILNVSAAGAPLEPLATPTFTLKTTVREARLSRGVTSGDLAMLDRLGLDWADPANNIAAPPGADSFPAAFMAPGSGGNAAGSDLFLYWSTNRRATTDAFIDTTVGNPQSGHVKAFAPWGIAYAGIPAPYGTAPITTGDFNFARPGTGAADMGWFTKPTLFLNEDSGGWGLSTGALFPSDSTSPGPPPYLAGVANIGTERHTSPAIAAMLDFSGGYNNLNVSNPESYLFWQGYVDKTTPSTAGFGPQVRDARTFWTSTNASNTPGIPSNAINSIANDPGQIKNSPKPLLVSLPAANGAPAQKLMYLFWHAGNQGHTSLYYNAAVSTTPGTAFSGNPWNPGGDIQLPTPGSLSWQSDPYPVYRQITFNGARADAIDVVFTGVLKDRQQVETLLMRYLITRTLVPNGPPIGTLVPIALPPVQEETMSRVGATNTFVSRDAAWAVGTGPLGALAPTDTTSQIAIYYVAGGGTAAPVLINQGATATTTQRGNFDQASGLIYYNNTVGGGQIVVDPRSGSITFPQAAPNAADRLLVSYTPQVMRLNASHDETNIDRSQAANFGNLINAQAFVPRPGIAPVGNNTNPVAFMDRSPNPRAQFLAPAVIAPAGSAPPVDRLWVLYRKNDTSGVAKSTIYYKAMRLMAKLPFPVLLTAPAANGTQQIASITVAGNLGPYEVDWARGRVYFTEIDEGSTVTVDYTYTNPANGVTGDSGKLVYRVAWGDEISTSTQQGDETTPEVTLPTDSAVNEGQVSAFKDPYLDKIWVFWTSTRAGSTDLYSETLSPQFYPLVTNQH